MVVEKTVARKIEQSIDLFTKEGTLLKVDLAGFSTFSREHKDSPHKMRLVPYKILGAAEEAAKRNGGVPLKRDGDATTISYNIKKPLKSSKDGAVMAVRSALHMQEAIEQMRRELELERNELKARIGISTGESEYGGYRSEVDGEDIFMPDINGFTMSVATRLEGQAELETVLVDERTYRLAEKHFEWEDKGKVSVKNIGEVQAYRPIREILPTFNISEIEEAFFGRKDEVAKIRHYQRKGGHPILIQGQMGIGKTATANEAIGHRHIVKFTALDRNDPFSVLRQFYRTVFSDSITEERLEKIGLKDEYAYIALPLGIDVSGYEIAEDPEVRRMKIINAYHSVRKMADIVLFDDVQWAPEFFFDLLRSAPAEQRNILTAREDFEPDFPVEAIQLHPLGNNESKQILEEFLGEYFSQLDEKAVGSIVSRTDGNPFHTKHLAISLREKMELKTDYKEALNDIPSELSSLVISRAQEYGDLAFRFLRVAAHLRRKYVYIRDIEHVIGQRLDHETIERMTKSGMIKKTRPETIEIEDEKVFEILHDSTPPDEQQRIHGKLGNYFEKLLKTKRNKTLVLNAATQYARSDQTSKAVPYLLELGRSERDEGATETSEEHLRTAREILGKEEDNWETDRKKLEVEEELEKTYSAMGLKVERRESQKIRVEIARKLKQTIDQNDYRGLAHIGDTLIEDNPDEAQRILIESKKMAEELHDKEYVLRITLSLGGCYLNKKEFQEARNLYQEVLSIATEPENLRQIYSAHRNIGIAYKREGQFEDAVREYRLAFYIAEKIGAKGLMAGMKRNLGYLENERGNVKLSLRSFEESLELAREVGRTETQIDNLCNIAYIHIKNKKIDQAKQYLEEGIRIIERKPSLASLSSGKYIIGEARKLQINI